MVDRWSADLVRSLLNRQLISKERAPYYEYAIITMVERTITIASILLIGVMTKCIIPIICFMIFFFSLRKRTGGFHADKFWQCYTSSIIIATLLYPISVFLENNHYIAYGLVGCAAGVIMIIGTVNHPNVNYNVEELRESKQAARTMVVIEISVICLAYAFQIEDLYVWYMNTSIILCAFLLLLAKLTGQEVKCHENEP